MNTNQRRRRIGPQIAHCQNHGLFRFGGTNAGKTKNTKLAETGGKIGFGYLIQF